MGRITVGIGGKTREIDWVDCLGKHRNPLLLQVDVKHYIVLLDYLEINTVTDLERYNALCNLRRKIEEENYAYIRDNELLTYTILDIGGFFAHIGLDDTKRFELKVFVRYMRDMLFLGMDEGELPNGELFTADLWLDPYPKDGTYYASQYLLMCFCLNLEQEIDNLREKLQIIGLVPYEVKSVDRNDSMPEEADIQLANLGLKSFNKVRLHRLFEALIQEHWISSDADETDWIYRITGEKNSGRQPSAKDIVFTSLNQCRYVVKNYLYAKENITGEQWELIKQVFAVKNGNIKNLAGATKTPSGAAIIDNLMG